MAAKKHNRKKTANKKQQPTTAEKGLRLMVLVTVVVSIVGMGWWQFISWMNNPDTLPVKVVRIDGDLKKLKIKKLEEHVAPVVTGGYFNIDLPEIKARALQLPWVDDVSIKRVWPDKLVMHISEKQAYARWGQSRLVTRDGKIFAPESGIDESLPGLIGRDERSTAIVETYQREQLRFAAFDLQIESLQLTERGSWVVIFDNGMQVLVGRTDVEKRMRRLADSLRLMQGYRGMPDRVDLRYPHGMAVSWKNKPDESKDGNKNQLEKLIAKEAV